MLFHAPIDPQSADILRELLTTFEFIRSRFVRRLFCFVAIPLGVVDDFPSFVADIEPGLRFIYTVCGINGDSDLTWL